MTSPSQATTLLRLLQIADSGFPSGGFSFSNGLEGLVHLRLLTDERGIGQVIQVQIEEGLGGIDLPAIVHAHRFATSGDIASLLRLDLLLTALRPVTTFHDASTRVGRRFLESAAVISDNQVIATYRESVHHGETAGHHATAWGLIAAGWSIEINDAAVAYASLTLHGQTAAAVRLGVIGQAAAQRIIRDIHPVILDVVAGAQSRTLGDLGAYQPLLDIAGLRQPTLDGRLFAS